MSNFGYLSPLLPNASGISNLIKRLPVAWQFWRGPIKAGGLSSHCLDEQVAGWGWRLPEDPPSIWEKRKIQKLWAGLLTDFETQAVKVIGIDTGLPFAPPPDLRKEPRFPGVSDGKALELLLFINRFRNILRNNIVSPQRSKALIVWEEGNLGLTCARLIAREVRFLILVNPNVRLLERAVDLIIAETGVAPQPYLVPPSDYKGAKIIIKCGRMSRYRLPPIRRNSFRCELFQNYPYLPGLNTTLPITVRNREGSLPLFPALGESILRAAFDLNFGYWYGPELPLERVLKLGLFFKELGIEIAL